MNPEGTSKVEEAVIKTLVYRDLFDYPLTAEEIWRFLIGRRASKALVNKVLAQLVTRKTIRKRDSYYFLPGREAVVHLRQRRKKISQKKFRRAARYARLLCPIPWVKAIFATGALAVGNANEGSDLDLLIVAARQRLWLTRFLTFLIFSLLGVRRSPKDTKVKDKVCPNMFLSEPTLTIPKNEQNLYTAHETVQVRPIWERTPLYRRFLGENSWVKEFLPNFKLPSKSDKSSFRKAFPFLDWLELFAYKIQLKYMERRRTREVATPERILFHPIDRAAEILSKFEARLVSFSPPTGESNEQ